MVEKLKINSPVLFKHRELPAGRILIVGDDITEEEKKILLGIGKEVSLVTGDAEMILTTAQPAPAGPTSEELEETRKYIVYLESELENAQNTSVALNERLAVAETALAAITDGEIAGILKARKVRIPVDADRETLLGHIAAGAQPGATEALTAGADESTGETAGTDR